MENLAPISGSPLIPPLSFILGNGAKLILISSLIFLLLHFRNNKLSFGHKFREFTLWIALLMLFTLGTVAYELLPTPEIVSTTPIQDTQSLELNSKIVIQFSRPVSRRSMDRSISPDVPGVWVFEDQLYASHFYQRLVFYPDDGLEPGTTYTIHLKNVKNTLQTSKGFDYTFSFKTKSDPIIAKAFNERKKETFKLPVPVFLQQHTLSCELASLKMTLAYKGITKSEEDLLNEVGVDNTPHVGGIWGNPYERFVGNVDGRQMRDGYGVYWGPIERVAKSYSNAQSFEHGDIKRLTSSILADNPVIIWVYSRNGTPTKWNTPNGQEIYAVAGEHTVVVVGFVGDPENPTQIIVNDPLVGQVYWSRALFDKKWASFSQSGVIVIK